MEKYNVEVHERFVFWYQNKKLHRVGGPAVVVFSKNFPKIIIHVEWWLKGIKYSKEKYIEKIEGRCVLN